MNNKKAILSVNIAVFFFGMAGLFAKFLSLPAIGITFGRVFFSSIALFIFCKIRRQSIRISQLRHLFILIGAGIILAFHWWSYLQSIQISTVAIGTITFSAFPLFVTFLEPLFFKERLKLKNVCLAVLTLVGVFITVPDFSLSSSKTAGIIIGMFSSFAYAVLTLINRYCAKYYESITISLYEQGTAAVVLLPFIVLIPMQPTLKDIGLLVILGVFSTALAHSLFTNSLKRLPAQLAGIVASMESVYGILLALVILGEIPSPQEVIGAVIIISAAVLGQMTQAKQPEAA